MTLILAIWDPDPTHVLGNKTPRLLCPSKWSPLPVMLYVTGLNCRHNYLPNWFYNVICSNCHVHSWHACAGMKKVLFQYWRVKRYDIMSGPSDHPHQTRSIANRSLQMNRKKSPYHPMLWKSLCRFLYPRSTKLKGGYTGMRLSVCPSVRLYPTVPVNALLGAILLRSRPDLVGTHLGARSRTSSFVGDAAR